MSREDNLQVVRRGYEAFARGDIAGLLELMADGVEWVTPGPAALATAGTRHGREGVASFFTTLNDLFAFEGFEPTTFLADGDRVVVFGTSTVRLRATQTLLPPTQWVHTFRVANGQVTHFQEIYDASPVAAELEAARQRT